MTLRLESVGSSVYSYSADAPPAAADRVRAIARMRVVDEITRAEVLQTIALTSERADLIPQPAASGGLVGVVGRPAQIFPELATTAVDIRLTINSFGYLPLEVSGTLGPIAGFPVVFAPLDFGDAPLHRPGVILAGRVVRNLTTPTPIAGASVVVEGIWSTLPPANWTPPALEEPPHLVALAPGLYASRAMGAAIARRDLALSTQTKTLAAPLTPGQTRVLISDRIGLSVGSVLAIDRDDPMRLEAIELAQVDTSSTSDQAAWVTLAHPARHLHLDGCVCTGATPQAPQAPTTFSRAGSAGDCVALLAAAPAYGAGVFVEIADGASPREFQRIDRYQTASDSAGFFSLPSIARVALVRLRVQHAGFTDSLPIVTLDYRQAVQRVTVAME